MSTALGLRCRRWFKDRQKEWRQGAVTSFGWCFGSIEVADQFAAMVDAEFVENGSKVGADGIDADAEVASDFVVAKAVGGELSGAELGLSKEVDGKAFVGFRNPTDTNADVRWHGLVCRRDEGQGGLKAVNGGMVAGGLVGFDGLRGVAQLTAELLEKQVYLLREISRKEEGGGMMSFQGCLTSPSTPPGTGFDGGGVVEHDLFL